jgi:hypothetical protein
MGAPGAGGVAGRGLAGDDERAALGGERLERGEVGVGEHREVGQHQHVEASGGGAEVGGVHREPVETGARQRPHGAAVGIERARGSAVAAEAVVVRLAPDHADAGERGAADEDVLVRLVPAEDRLGGAVLPAILVAGADVVPPRLDAAGEARR